MMLDPFLTTRPKRPPVEGESSRAIPRSMARIKTAITDKVNGSRQILGFASSRHISLCAGFRLLTGRGPNGMLRRVSRRFQP
jgi:hypothetical protein